MQGQLSDCLKTHSTVHTVQYALNKGEKFWDFSSVECALHYTRLTKAAKEVKFLLLGASPGGQNHFCSKESSGRLL